MIDASSPLADGASIEVAGARVDSFTVASFVDRVLAMASTGGTEVAVGINAHVCNLARHNRRFSDLLSRSITYADGQSVVWGARLLGGTLPERLATTDIAEPILRAAAAASLPVYF
ncbi:MAG TPA: WecB/TagA/CpsF family glycosyltransferase, partial [Microbacterium sp.]|nr:WecB/TagA/CpsF family glycosyltransferase [Microbacterium sp.]